MNDVPLAELWISVSADVNGAITGLPRKPMRELIIRDEEDADAFIREIVRQIAFARYPKYSTKDRAN